jgi:hypothetical protein
VGQLRFAEGRCAIDQSCGRRAEHHPAGRCDRLHSLCHTDLQTDGGVTEWPRTDFTSDHLTGIKTNPQLQVQMVAGLDFTGELLGFPLKIQGGTARAYRMVLQRGRCPEHRHDPVTRERSPTWCRSRARKYQDSPGWGCCLRINQFSFGCVDQGQST